VDVQQSRRTVVLDDAYAAYVFAHNSILGGDLAVKAGQYKPQVVHEQYLGDQFQLAADRSLANFLIGGGDIGPRVQGVSLLLTGNDTPLHAEILVDDGDRSVNTDFQDARPAPVPVAPPPGAGTIAADAVYWGAGGRVDYKFFGDWKDFGDFTSHNAKKDVLIVGAGIHASQQTNSTTLHYTVDAQWKMAQHLSLFGAVYGRHLETRNTLIGGRDDIGGMAQIGYELTRSLEVFGRYSLVALDSDFVAAGAARQIHEITGGVNWYMGPDGSWGHHAKITLDVTYLPNGSPVNAGSTDILSNGGKKDEVVFRGQLQLWI
jgi:hypothetical protein